MTAFDHTAKQWQNTGPLQPPHPMTAEAIVAAVTRLKAALRQLSAQGLVKHSRVEGWEGAFVYVWAAMPDEQFFRPQRMAVQETLATCLKGTGLLLSLDLNTDLDEAQDIVGTYPSRSAKGE